jgi:hypothetical protein
MKKIIVSFIIVLFCIFTIACSGSTKIPEQVQESHPAQKTIEETKSRSIDDLIPKGWELFERGQGEPVKTEGDLNEDGISDIAAVIKKTGENKEVQPRALLIAFGNKDKSYTLSTIAEKSILGADKGGVWGDPLEGISINRGSVLISFYGGSNWRWYQSYRFRYQDKGWYLIGATLGSYFTGTTDRENADEEDFNLITGDYIIKKTNDNSKQITTKGNRGKRPLVNLKDFIPDADNRQF